MGVERACVQVQENMDGVTQPDPGRQSSYVTGRDGGKSGESSVCNNTG